MRLLKRNTTEFEYWPWSGLTSDVDENGDHTGEPKPVYDEPVKYRGTISTPSGYAVQAFYGTDVRYSHVLVMDKTDADIRETGLICWKGEKYDIRAIRPSLNVLLIALRKQTVNNAEGDQ